MAKDGLSGYINASVVRVYKMRQVGKDKKNVVDFTVVVKERKRNGDNWVDGDPLYLSCTAWDNYAKHIAESFRAGDRVILTGSTKMKAGYTKENGEEVEPRMFFSVETAGHDLLFESFLSPRKDNPKGPGNDNMEEGSASKRAASTTSKAAPKKRAAAAKSADEEISDAIEDWGDDLGDDDEDFDF